MEVEKRRVTCLGLEPSSASTAGHDGGVLVLGLGAGRYTRACPDEVGGGGEARRWEPATSGEGVASAAGRLRSATSGTTLRTVVIRGNTLELATPQRRIIQPCRFRFVLGNGGAVGSLAWVAATGAGHQESVEKAAWRARRPTQPSPSCHTLVVVADVLLLDAGGTGIK